MLVSNKLMPSGRNPIASKYAATPQSSASLSNASGSVQIQISGLFCMLFIIKVIDFSAYGTRTCLDCC